MSDPAPIERKSPYAFALAITGELALVIAVPAVLFAVIGKKLDMRFGSYPRYVVIGLLCAFVISSVIIWKRTKVMKAIYDKQL